MPDHMLASVSVKHRSLSQRIIASLRAHLPSLGLWMSYRWPNEGFRSARKYGNTVAYILPIF